MMTQGPLHVLIAGGGLSGLALAQRLIKDGHTCEVFARDADLSRKRGYYLHMNGDGGAALRRCLPAGLFELYAETSRQTPDRRESIVLDDQLPVLSSQPHLGPPNEGTRPHTGVHRRTLRQILLARLGDPVRPGRAAVSYAEQRRARVRLRLDDGRTAERRRAGRRGSRGCRSGPCLRRPASPPLTPGAPSEPGPGRDGWSPSGTT